MNTRRVYRRIVPAFNCAVNPPVPVWVVQIGRDRFGCFSHREQAAHAIATRLFERIYK
jgi:3-isopropylmalate dehydratase small subunit